MAPTSPRPRSRSCSICAPTRWRWRCTARCEDCTQSSSRTPARYRTPMQRSEPAAETLWALAPARGRLAAAGPGVVTFAIVAGLCAANGGYDAPSWGWGAALLATVALTGLLVRQRVTVSRAEAVTLAAFGGLTLCMLASTAWSSDPAAGVLAAERGLVYVAGLAALAFTARRGSAAAIL